MSDDVYEEPKTLEQARKIIDSLRFRNGVFSETDEEHLKRMDPEWRSKLELGFAHNRKSLAALTRIVSSQLYSSKFRFIYELIQNADDVPYNNIGHDTVPSLEFRIESDKIIIDSNEDGFSVANVYAICATAQSSKKNDKDTTGEKGLGFKSVFAIADRVHIQSGLWSFEFLHTGDDDGLGMTTPHWKDSVPLKGTRITLNLAERDEEGFQELIKAFQDISDTVLLFLRNIEALTICFGAGEGLKRNHIFKRGDRWDANQKHTSVDINGKWTDFRYRLWASSVQVPPKGKPHDKGSPTQWPKTKVELAFPISTSDSMPFISARGQHIFTFLPMKRMQNLPFIIQADFDTAASREVVLDEARNKKLRQTVADSFAAAVSHFCHVDEHLRFSWMQYMPGDQLDGFWESLRELINDALRTKSLLLDQSGKRLYLISNLRVVPSNFQHQGAPLFERQDYISKDYDQKAVKVLRDLGLPTLGRKEMIQSVSSDLLLPDASSLVKSKDLGDSWHTTFLKCLCEYICVEPEAKFEVGKLSILPVWTKDGISWTAPSEISDHKRIYFPQVADDDHAPVVPYDLGLRVLHPEACKLPERRRFYRFWTIDYLKRKTVIKAILNVNPDPPRTTVDCWVQELAIMFWHDVEPSSVYGMLACSEKEDTMEAWKLYFASDKAYSTYNLLTEFRSTEFGLLHEKHLSCSVKHHKNRDGLGWTQWLEVVGIRHYPHLVGPSGQLSAVFEEVIRQRPEMVIGTLKTHWRDYKAKVAKYPKILNSLKEAKVRCRDGMTYKLEETVLPTEVMISACQEFGVRQAMHLLAMEGNTESVDFHEWSFLETFGVTCGKSLKFHLDALHELERTQTTGPDVIVHAIAIYKSLGSIGNHTDKKELSDHFHAHPAVFDGKKWSKLDECVWEGPDFEIAKAVLAREYTDCDANDYAAIEHLFVNLLDIRNADYKDVLTKIERLSEQGSSPADATLLPNLGRMSKMYQSLDELLDSVAREEEIRDLFRIKPLIFDGKYWRTVSSCVWSSAVVLQGRPILEDLYPELKDFFTARLRVTKMTTTRMLGEVIRIAKGQTKNPNEVKDLLREISSMIKMEGFSDLFDRLKELQQLECLPVVVGSPNEPTFIKPGAAFFIVDDRRLGDAFRQKVRLLDFSFNEFTLMQPLYSALRLEDDDWTYDLSVRAYALSCCALAYSSVDIKSYREQRHGQLINCEVLTSHDIHTTINLIQDRKILQVKSDIALVKMSEESDKLKVFVPADFTSRRSCYRAHLPGQMMKFLGLFDQRAEKPIYRILNEPLRDLSDIMEEEGIEEISKLERVEWLDEDAAPSLAASQEGDLFCASQKSVDTRDMPIRSLVTPRSVLPNQVQDSSSPDGYLRVLKHVLRQAQSTKNSDKNESQSSSKHVLEISPERWDLGILKGQVITSDALNRIGAAGELFVFNRIQSAGFDVSAQHHWRSNIRHLVRILTEYQNLQEYEQNEIADIMYEVRTQNLGNAGRFFGTNALSRWANSETDDISIQLYIEVKTTINDCNEPFFMTNHQYQLLSKNALVDNQRPKVLYIVARVYNLLSDNIGLKFFVDPKSMEGSLLNFEAKDWRVTPL